MESSKQTVDKVSRESRFLDWPMNQKDCTFSFVVAKHWKHRGEITKAEMPSWKHLDEAASMLIKHTGSCAT